MKAKGNYENNPLGLSPSFLAICEAIGKAFVTAHQKNQQAQRESQIVDTDYEEVKPNLLPQNTLKDEM
ncbi:hypothetical protein [Runella sp. SP2]|uniref:hypothetical protein n=1 Tax=Runella sp. SP2 TaxID=2268026 RepID=UPI000F08612A|nr:hypothetical protein [Runella sp. SP2]AYQ31961.1 hypothetical protein DTQ70_07150 [Runella sp. SP2]